MYRTPFRIARADDQHGLVPSVALPQFDDLSRFDHPRQPMAWVGVTPSEHSSGQKRQLGSITKAGNSYARRLLIEAARSYRHPAKVSPAIQKRHDGLPKAIIDRAWDAQLQALPQNHRTRQAPQRCCGGDRPRTGGLHLGHRADDAHHVSRAGRVSHPDQHPFTRRRSKVSSRRRSTVGEQPAKILRDST
jgi:hypothetical protein